MLRSIIKLCVHGARNRSKISEKELINCIDHVIKLFRDYLLRFVNSFSDRERVLSLISKLFLASWTQDFRIANISWTLQFTLSESKIAWYVDQLYSMILRVIYCLYIFWEIWLRKHLLYLLFCSLFAWNSSSLNNLIHSFINERCSQIQTRLYLYYKQLMNATRYCA